jgi:hypothetical protein
VSSDSDNDVSTSFSTGRPHSPTLSLTIKQEVAFLAENIDASDYFDEELSGPENFSPTPLAAFAAPRLGGSPALRLSGLAALRNYAPIATVI